MLTQTICIYRNFVWVLLWHYFFPPTIYHHFSMHSYNTLNETVMKMINTTHDHFTFKNKDSFLQRQTHTNIVSPSRTNRVCYSVLIVSKLAKDEHEYMHKICLDVRWWVTELMGGWTDVFSWKSSMWNHFSLILATVNDANHQNDDRGCKITISSHNFGNHILRW